MNTLKQIVGDFLSDEQGATAIEYGLLASLIAVVIIAGITAIGTSLDALFKSIAEKLGK